jgi:uncharacterized protein (UPF0335 family)
VRLDTEIDQMIGHNTESGQQLQTYVERVERLRTEKKQITTDEAAVLAEAKANGFVPSAIKHVCKVRAMKPQDRQEAEAIIDTYMHAMGMAMDTPLFRHVSTMTVDRTSRDSVIEALKAFVPDNGSIVVEAGGKPVKLTRDRDGNVTVVDVVEQKPRPSTSSTVTPNRPDPPSCDADGAEDLGRSSFKANEPIISNPFPFGDARRGRWDAGWRKESGGDGMGPDRGDD